MLKSFKIGGVHPPENKLSASGNIQVLPIPEKVIIPLGQHIGAPATPVVQKGDKVKAGQLLVSFDKEKIESEGYSCEIPIIITNTTDYLDVVELDHGQHNHGDKMLKVVR